jgi:hypothetical protein
MKTLWDVSMAVGAFWFLNRALVKLGTVIIIMRSWDNDIILTAEKMENSF